MPETQLFRLGADVRCTDGDCGKIKSLVISRGDDTVSHLVVEPAHRQGLGKLVPLGLAGTTVAQADGGVRLRCTMAEFGQLDPAEATYFFPGDQDYEIFRREPVVSWPYYVPTDAMVPGGPPGTLGSDVEATQVVTIDTVPEQLPDEDEVSRGARVHAQDGDTGHILGIVVDTGSGRVHSVLLREGHLRNRRAVLIPRSAVAEVGADGFHLSITRQQVQQLPPAVTD